MGIFPSAYAVDSDYSDWDSNFEHGHRERYLLGYLGSVETLAHKGTSVVCQAVRRVVGHTGSEPDPQPCILEVSDQGLRMVDRRKRKVTSYVNRGGRSLNHDCFLGERSLHRLLLLFKKCFLLCISSSRSPLLRLYY